MKTENVFEIKQHMSITQILELIRKNCALASLIPSFFNSIYRNVSDEYKVALCFSVKVIKTFNEHEIQLWLWIHIIIRLSCKQSYFCKRLKWFFLAVCSENLVSVLQFTDSRRIENNFINNILFKSSYVSVQSLQKRNKFYY